MHLYFSKNINIDLSSLTRQVIHMRRSVIKTGPSTFSVSLPSEWIKRFSIGKGDELNIEEIGSSLMIKPGSASIKKKASFRFKKKQHFLRRYIKIMYILGYDEVELSCDEPFDIGPINDILLELSGFEIIDSRPRNFRIKSIHKSSSDEFAPIFRRLFRQDIQMAEDCLSALKSRDQDALNSLIPTQVTNNRLVNLLLRLDNKFSIIQERNYIYFYINSLEQVSDHLRDICLYVLEKKPKISSSTTGIFSRIIHYMKTIHKNYYKFNEEETIMIKEERLKLFDQMQEYIDNSTREEMQVLFYLLKILDLLHHMEIYLISNAET